MFTIALLKRNIHLQKVYLYPTEIQADFPKGLSQNQCRWIFSKIHFGMESPENLYYTVLTAAQVYGRGNLEKGRSLLTVSLVDCAKSRKIIEKDGPFP
jgi:hypothetical protein